MRNRRMKVKLYVKYIIVLQTCLGSGFTGIKVRAKLVLLLYVGT